MKSVMRSLWKLIRHTPLLVLSVLLPHVILLHVCAAVCGEDQEAIPDAKVQETPSQVSDSS